VNRSTLSLTAVAGFIIFPLIVLILHFAQYGQDQDRPLREAVSELALGRAGFLMAIAFCAMAVGTLALAAVIRHTTDARVAPVLLTVAGSLTLLSAFVHADGPNASTTTHGTVHQAAGVLTFLLLVATMFSLVRPFRRSRSWESLARPTRTWGTLAVIAFVLIPLSGSGYFGLAQRAFLALCIGWVLVVAVHTRRIQPETIAAVQIPRRPNRDIDDQQAGLRSNLVPGP
jgi:Protein of unknown function (DUF998)